MVNYNELPIHDFENDQSISEKRKEACRINYTDMELHHIDKLYTSTFVYDKKTGEPIARKPKSVHELIFNLMKAAQALTQEIDSLKTNIKQLMSHIKHRDEKINRLQDTVDQLLIITGQSKGIERNDIP